MSPIPLRPIDPVIDTSAKSTQPESSAMSSNKVLRPQYEPYDGTSEFGSSAFRIAFQILKRWFARTA